MHLLETLPGDQLTNTACVQWQPDCPPDQLEELLRRRQEMKDLYSTEGPSESDRGHLGQLVAATNPIST